MLICMISVTSCASQGVTSIEEKKEAGDKAADTGLSDGTYDIDITMEGGTGKAYIKSPVSVTVKDGKMTAALNWSSPNYDYMIVGGEKYLNEAPAGEDSSFTVKVDDISKPLSVIADTTAMSKPHEIEYVITFHMDGEGAESVEDSAGEDGSGPDKADDAGGAGSEDLSDLLGDKTGEMDLKYAKCFKVEYYGDNSLISIGDDKYLLLRDESAISKEERDSLKESAVIIKSPASKAYVVSSSVMDHLRQCGVLDKVRLSGTKKEDWYLGEVRNAMERGDILYAGKYSAPDYELILSEGCDLAIENTMIYHKPEVKEKLEELGIPVIVEMSSYETHPLGRLEWIKLYGLLFGKEKEATEYYDAQVKAIEPIMEKADTGKKVGFFYISDTGMINVKKPGDYISKMIELSGGEYVIQGSDNVDENASSGMNMQMEEFYKAAKDADILIYNSTIGGEITELNDLIGKNELFSDFKAVQNGQVYCTSRDFFQESTHIAEFMNDLNNVFTGKESDLLYLNKLK